MSKQTLEEIVLDNPNEQEVDEQIYKYLEEVPDVNLDLDDEIDIKEYFFYEF